MSGGPPLLKKKNLGARPDFGCGGPAQDHRVALRELLAVKTFDFGIRTVEHRQQRIELKLLQCLRQVERVVAVFLRVIEIKRYFAALAGRQSRRQSRRRDRGQMLVDEIDELAEAIAFDLVGR